MAHGGPNKAAYAYAVEDTRWWEQEIGQSLSYGQFGENLTTEGIEVNNALLGMLRGGSWFDSANQLRSPSREVLNAIICDDSICFRVVAFPKRRNR